MDGTLWILIVAWIAGVALGGWYFGGLWLTVQQLPTASSPAFLALISFWIRLLGCVSGFYVVMGGHWERLAICFLGFLGMRAFLMRRWQPEKRPLVTTLQRGQEG